MRTLLLTLALSAVSTVSAEPIYTSICTAYGVATVIGTTGCSIPNPGLPSPSFASYASSSASVQIDQNTVTAQGLVVASAFGIRVPDQILFGPTTASTSVSLKQQLLTTGPMRQGLLLISADGISNYGGDFYTRLTGLDGPSIITGGILCGNCAIHAAPPFSFALGRTFTLEFEGGAAWESTPSAGGGSSGSSAKLTFTFTELDGTPVNVVAAPEPASLGLLGISLSAFALIGLLRRRLAKTYRPN